ncbi:MAG: DsbA family oxidoreductase [Acidimicrobiia bacterium]
MVQVASGTIVVWSDIACPWATAAVYHLHAARARLGLEGAVTLDHRAFPLELLNSRPTPRAIVDAEVPVVGALAPDFGFSLWTRDPAAYPSTVLLALEAVQAAKEQSLAASDRLDLALRRALFAESSHVGMRHAVLEVATAVPEVDTAALEVALDSGRGRRAVIDQWRAIPDAGVQGSPHLFLPDGSDVANPGVTMHWVGRKPGGFPVVDAYDPSIYEDILTRAK